MNMLINTILKEKSRIEFMLDSYNKMLNELPKGSISSNERNGKIYYSLKYREGNRVISKYIGKSAEEVSLQIEKRKHAEKMIKLLKEELKIAEKALEGNV